MTQLLVPIVNIVMSLCVLLKLGVTSVHAADSDTDEGPSFHETVLDRILGCCIRLKYTLPRLHSKGLFPYPVGGIIPLLERLEEKYEVGTCIP